MEENKTYTIGFTRILSFNVLNLIECFTETVRGEIKLGMKVADIVDKSGECT